VPKADLVLEGGGMKGLGLVGAVLTLMRAGYHFPRVAGTSAGSIVGAFVAAGATVDQVDDIMGRLEYRKVSDRRLGVPFVGEGLSLLTRSGAYEGDYIRDFVADELAKLGVRTFADLRRTDRGGDPALAEFNRYKLIVMATDITRGRLLRLPWDYELLGLDPDEQLVADAVRASISIPLYFEPVTLRHDGHKTVLVDGGVLSNFPIAIFDRTDGGSPRWPTLGVKVIPELPEGDVDLFPAAALPALPPIRLAERVIATAIVGNDQTYLDRPCVRRRAIFVDTSAVGAVEFDAPEDRRREVVRNGERAAGDFLETWSWTAYLRECRGGVLG
jgi:NTE family protein